MWIIFQSKKSSKTVSIHSGTIQLTQGLELERVFNVIIFNKITSVSKYYKNYLLVFIFLRCLPIGANIVD